jgi:hypothetical protein
MATPDADYLGGEVRATDDYCNESMAKNDTKCGGHGCWYALPDGRNGTCKCRSNWGGADCKKVLHGQNQFRIVAIFSVAIPTFLLLVIAWFVWYRGKESGDEFGSRPTLYTYPGASYQ